MMQQRTFEGEPLPETAREHADAIVGARLEPGVGERVGNTRVRILNAVQTGEKPEILAGREIGVQKKIVAKHADSAAELFTDVARKAPAVPDFSRGGPGQRGENPEQGRFARAIRPEETHDLARTSLQADARQRTPSAEMARDVPGFDKIEVEGHSSGPA